MVICMRRVGKRQGLGIRVEEDTDSSPGEASRACRVREMGLLRENGSHCEGSVGFLLAGVSRYLKGPFCLANSLIGTCVSYQPHRPPATLLSRSALFIVIHSKTFHAIIPLPVIKFRSDFSPQRSPFPLLPASPPPVVAKVATFISFTVPPYPRTHSSRITRLRYRKKYMNLILLFDDHLAVRRHLW